MKDGYVYRIDARNARVGIWVEKAGTFLLPKMDMGFETLQLERYTDGSIPVALEEIEEAPFPKLKGCTERDFMFAPCVLDKEEYAEVYKYLREKEGR